MCVQCITVYILTISKKKGAILLYLLHYYHIITFSYVYIYIYIYIYIYKCNNVTIM